MSDESFKRYRFSVPNADTSVNQWIEQQASLSHSLRALIRNRIIEHGMTDPTCDSVTQRPKVGRPSNAELAQREMMRQDEEIQENEPATKDVKQELPHVAAQEPQIRRQMQFPVVDGTESMDMPEKASEKSPETLPDMTAFMGH